MEESEKGKYRTFINSKEQIELTKSVKIMAKPCYDSQPISVFINSAAKYHKRREIQRKTWVSDVKDHNISVYFVVGMTDNQIDEQMIKNESQKYKDLIQMGFYDNYYNNTLKSISILRWIKNYCNQSKFILKTDDDVLVNIDLFLENLDELKPGIHGLLYRGVRANRNKTARWYMPQKYYNKRIYPVYTPGAAYLMTGDIVNSLVTGIEIYQDNFIDVDDVFITGIIANQMGIKRYFTNLVGISCYNKCHLYKYGAIFGCKDLSIEKTWFKWKNSTIKKCFPNGIQRKLIINSP